MDADFSISLTIDQPGGKTKTQEFTSGEPIMIGSGGSAHVRIEDEEVSSLHCMIKPNDSGGLVVLDLGSDEGTFVNGKEITGERTLADGEVVKIGDTRIAVHFGGDMLAPTVPIRQMQDAPLKKEELADTHLDLKTRGAAPDVTLPEPESVVDERGVIDDDRTMKQGPAPDVTMDQPEPPKASAKSSKSGKKKSAPRSKRKTGETKARDNVAASDKAEKASERSTSKSSSKTSSKKSAAHSAVSTGHHGKALMKTSELSPELGDDEKASNKGNLDVTMMWGGSVMGVQRLSGNGSITIGDAPKNTFQVSDAAIPGATYELVKLAGGGASIAVANGMTLEVDGKPVTGNHNLDIGQKAVVKVGAIEFVVQFSQRYLPISVSLVETLDFVATKIAAIALILQIGLVVAFYVTHPINESDDDDLMDNLNEFQQLILTPPEKKKEKKQDLSGKKGAKAKEDEGLFGKKDKPKEDKAASKKGAPTVDKDKREEDRKIAFDALAKLGLSGDKGAVSNVFGPGGLGTGINNALGGLKGASMGDAGGAGGLGSRGTGAGGGGNALGIGGIGSGTGRGSGGRGGVDLGGRGKGRTKIKPGKVRFTGSLTKEEIERVLRRVKNQIKHCYDKEVAKNPNLKGKVVVQWVIQGTGLVKGSKAVQNTVGSPTVGKCVTRVIGRLRFPKPRGGGTVLVTYPYVFSL